MQSEAWKDSMQGMEIIVGLQSVRNSGKQNSARNGRTAQGLAPVPVPVLRQHKHSCISVGSESDDRQILSETCYMRHKLTLI
jgi:hypothetical protein